MDVVRYGESYGHEFDYGVPHAYQYRDYLIRAFNSDVPYDQFIREHIAGDLMTNPRLNEQGYNDSVRGTGFWWLGEAVHARSTCDRTKQIALTIKLMLWVRLFWA